MRFGNKYVSISKYGKATVNIIYYGAKIAWQAIRSCFGSGMWNGEKPWIGTDAWKNN